MALRPTLEEKRVLVTGAASGIGRAVALRAAAQGASVAMLDIDEPGLEETASMAANGNALVVPVDLTDSPAVQTAVDGAVARLGGLDVVCNVVGWDDPGRFWEQPLELWEKLLAVNLWSMLNVCRATVPVLIEQRAGTIVSVASDAARVGSKGESVYAAAKGGVVSLTKSLARELAPHSVTMNCVCPGPTRTPLMQAELESSPKLVEKLVKAIPMRRVAEPEDIAAVITFFGSDAAGYMTGQVVSVSGGLTMAG